VVEGFSHPVVLRCAMGSEVLFYPLLLEEGQQAVAGILTTLV
jgi:hypothetical protein